VNATALLPHQGTHRRCSSTGSALIALSTSTSSSRPCTVCNVTQPRQKQNTHRNETPLGSEHLVGKYLATSHVCLGLFYIFPGKAVSNLLSFDTLLSACQTYQLLIKPTNQKNKTKQKTPFYIQGKRAPQTQQQPQLQYPATSAPTHICTHSHTHTHTTVNRYNCNHQPQPPTASTNRNNTSPQVVRTAPIFSPTGMSEGQIPPLPPYCRAVMPAHIQACTPPLPAAAPLSPVAAPRFLSVTDFAC
jgi:hypothetical protein